MDIRPCKRCKNLFQYITGRPICPQCMKKEEEMFGKVKDFLRANPGAEMQVVSMETEVPVHIIESFIRAGRLEISEHSPLGIPCERCGVMIRTGKYCKVCSKMLEGQLSQMANELKVKVQPKKKEEETRARMRFFNEETRTKK